MNEQALDSSVSSLAPSVDPDGAKLAVLRLLAQRPDLTQRELSTLLGISLGKTHYVLRALVEKGLVKIRNFQRSDRKLAYAYVLTPSGLRERARITRRFLARKETEFESLGRMIEVLRTELAPQEGAADNDLRRASALVPTGRSSRG